MDGFIWMISVKKKNSWKIEIYVIYSRILLVGLMMIFSVVTESASRKAFSSSPTMREVAAAATSS